MKTDSRNTAESRPWRALALWSTVVPAAILLALAVAPFAAARRLRLGDTNAAGPAAATVRSRSTNA